MPQPQLDGLDSYLSAVRAPGLSLRDQYKGKPVELAESLGLRLPRKPVQVMRELGVYNPEQHGMIFPGLRELVEDVCTLAVLSAAVVGPRGGGKAAWVETPVPTPSGWKPLGLIVPGDEVFDDQGRVCRVVEAHPVRCNDTCYRVGFDDGSSTVVSGEHLWATQIKPERAGWRSNTAAQVRTTEEVKNTITYGAKEANHSIDNAAPLALPWRELPIHPYVLGYWLGDGETNSGSLSVGSLDREALKQRLDELGEVWHQVPSREDVVRISGLTAKLRGLGVLGRKHIPNSYLRAGEAQRRELLAGLMDSDGCCRGVSNNCVFGVKLEALARDVQGLLHSLGEKTRWKHKVGKWKGGTFDAYLVNFRPSQQVFGLKRKADLLRFGVQQSGRSKRRFITSVVPTPTVPVRCIEVDSDSHLFLLGEQMVPTHNSQGVSFIEFYLVFIELFDALNLGGSELQADQVYQYLTDYIESDEYWQDLVKGEPMASKTTTIDQAWIRVLTASQKSVRSPHAGGRKKSGRMAGGILVIDEEAEADAKIVSAALPTINTARPSVNVRSSTFHNAVGSFADLIESHEEMGYTKYQWDVFDVAVRCEDECAACEPCFANDHWEEVLNPDTGQTERKLIHRAYCGGRAHYADGWVPVEEIKTLWKRGKRNHSNFEVEQMGSKPSSAGYVIKDMDKFKANITSASAASLYVPRDPITICVDWGSSNAGVGVWQEQRGDRHVLLRADFLQDYGEAQVFGVILGYAATYRAELAEIACDIGGGGTYFNPVLREQHRLPVRDVDFGADKELSVGAWNIYNEAGLTVIPEVHEEFISQVKKWRRVNGRINKGGDHLCDMTICYFAKFAERLNLRRPHVPPKSVNTATATPRGGVPGTMRQQQPIRRPVGIRAIGGR